MSKHTIQQLNESHSERVTKLLGEFRDHINSIVVDPIFQLKPRSSSKMAEVFLKLSQSGKVYAYGSFLGDQISAILLGRIEDKPYLVEEKTLFLDVAVTHKNKQNQGMMKSLVLHAEEWAKQNNIPSIELRAICTNESAVNFWKKMGYNPFYLRFRKVI
jgi:GNAT superfamily N-acetyltransferase